MILVNCDWCGKESLKKPNIAAKQKNLFCSTACYHAFKARNQIKTTCERCGKEVIKSPCKATSRNFCSSQCLMKTLNAELNKSRMTPVVRMKMRFVRLGTGEGKCYKKFYGRQEHRVIAEIKIGRPLKKGEVVHHIDGDFKNNKMENLMVLPSQSVHTKLHASEKKRRGGGSP